MESYDLVSDIAVLRVYAPETRSIRPLVLASEFPSIATKAYVIGAPAGLVSGPKIFRIVRMPSSLRTGAAYFMAG